MLIDINKLIPTHNRLRNRSTVDKFLSNVDFLHKAMSNKTDKVMILDIDDKLYVHNGHHRLVAYSIIYDSIDSELLNITKYTIEQMLSIDLNVGWVTPYDPEFFCRIPNFKDLKAKIIKTYNLSNSCRDESIKDMLTDDARAMSSWIIEPRKVQTLRELYYESN